MSTDKSILPRDESMTLSISLMWGDYKLTAGAVWVTSSNLIETIYWGIKVKYIYYTEKFKQII